VKPIFIVLSEGYSDWEIGPLAGLGRAFYGADISFLSLDGGPLVSAGGLKIAETGPLLAPDDCVLVVCGSPFLEQGEQPALTAVLRLARDKGCPIAGICGGTLALAHTGLLDRAKHTSNAPGYIAENVPGYRGASNYVDTPRAVADKGLVTAPATAPASFAVAVLNAAGLASDTAAQIEVLLAREHGA